MSRRQLKAVPPPADDPEMWRKLMNHLYGCEQDTLFRWARLVSEEIRRAEDAKRRGAA